MTQDGVVTQQRFLCVLVAIKNGGGDPGESDDKYPDQYQQNDGLVHPRPDTLKQSKRYITGGS